MKSFFDFLIQLINKLHLKEFTLILFFILFWYLVFPDWAVQILLSKTPKYFPDWLTLVEPSILCLSLICTLLFEPLLSFLKRQRVKYLTKRALRKLSDDEKELLISLLTSPQGYITLNELTMEAKSLWNLGLIAHHTQPNLGCYCFTIQNKAVFQECGKALLR